MTILRSVTALALVSAASGVVAQTASTSQQAGIASTGPIEIGGAQPVICGASFDRTLVTVDLTQLASQEVGVAVDCNTRFKLTARSAFGALRSVTGYDQNDPRTFVRYDVAWPVGLIDSLGGAIAPNFSASGQIWANGLAATSAATRQVQRGDMTIAWGGGLNAYADTYADTFFLDIVAN